MTITVSCPSCDTSFPVDPGKIPLEGVRAQCSNCPEIFDVDRPSEATREAPPARESTIETIEASDPLVSALVDPPPLEESVEGSESTTTGGEPTYGDTSKTQDFVAIDLAIEPPDTPGSAAEIVDADATPVSAPLPGTAESTRAEEPSVIASGGPLKSPDAPGAIRFGRCSAEDKAKSLARSLVSDLIAYNPKKHKEAFAEGTLLKVFGEEIDKSLKEYQEQVEPEVMAQGTFFNDALNSILAEEQSLFTFDD